MAEYIGCRNCESPDCKGCNLKNLETMLNNGKFDCLMNENHCINPSADVAPVRHGKWIVCGDGDNVPWMCSHCGKTTASKYKMMYGKFCPNCGCKMDLEG